MTVVPRYHMSIVGSFFPEDFEQKMLESARVKLHELTAEHLDDALSIQHVVGLGTVYEEVFECGR